MSDPTPSKCPFVCRPWRDCMRGCDLLDGHAGPHVDPYGSTHGKWAHRDSDTAKGWFDDLDRMREANR